MKRFKELRSEMLDINEEQTSEGGGMGFDPVLKSKGRSANDDVKPVNYDDPHDMHKMNAFITAFCSKSYVDPRSAIYVLRAKMNLAGVDFDFNRATALEPETEYRFPLKRFGGTFGTSPTHDLSKGFETTNGFDGRNYVLKMKIVKPEGGDKAGLYMINAIIEEA